MNPARRVRCNMRRQIELGRGDCNFQSQAPLFLLDCLGHDATVARRVVASPGRRFESPAVGRIAANSDSNSAPCWINRRRKAVRRNARHGPAGRGALRDPRLACRKAPTS